MAGRTVIAVMMMALMTGQAGDNGNWRRVGWTLLGLGHPSAEFAHLRQDRRCTITKKLPTGGTHALK